MPIVTGDTKVVDHGAADGMYISTSGVGVIPAGRELSAARVADGDVVICSGTIGDHGTAVMLARGDLALEADIVSDTAPLHDLVERLLAAAPSTRWLRDATRGGVGTVCNELARDSNLTVVLEEAALPVRPAVAAACELLGIDPLYVANEGKFVAVVAPDEADAALAALRATRWAATPSRSARSGPSRPASWCSSPPSAAPGSSTCWSAIRCRASADALKLPVIRNPASASCFHVNASPHAQTGLSPPERFPSDRNP